VFYGHTMAEIRFGVLQLEKGRTYGRQMKPNGKQGKLYYGIIPAVKSDLPVKVAYEPVKLSSKVQVVCNIHKNRFVSYRIISSIEGERPIANLVDNYGPVDNLEAIVKYRFAVKGLELRPKFGKSLYSVLPDINQHAINHVRSLNDYEPIPIITIDPLGCNDIDDGVGLTDNYDGSYTINICITHLPSYLTSEHINTNDFEESIRNPCSVYLPDHTIHMFDQGFSLPLFSLFQGKTCPVLCLRLTVDNDGTIVQRSLTVQMAYVKRNHSYDSDELLNDKTYANLLRIIRACFTKNPIASLNSIVDSHDLIIDDVKLPNELLPLKHIICNRASNYVDCSSLTRTPYCHITSPMRRLPDLINMILVTKHLYNSFDYSKFDRLIEKSMDNVEAIDALCKSAKKISEETQLLADIYNNKIDLSNIYEAIVIEQVKSSLNIYNVYVQELGKWFKVKTSEELEQFKKVKCRILPFEKADTLIRKVRLCIEN